MCSRAEGVEWERSDSEKGERGEGVSERWWDGSMCVIECLL